MLNFERVPSDSDLFIVLRAQIPGGWLVVADAAYGTGVTFVPDAEHGWKIPSLPLRNPSDDADH